MSLPAVMINPMSDAVELLNQVYRQLETATVLRGALTRQGRPVVPVLMDQEWYDEAASVLLQN